MTNIQDLRKKYHAHLAPLDLELLFSSALHQSREFVLAHPEYKLSKSQISNLKSQIARRKRGEPLAYILGQKEFYGLAFKVNKNTLIPRPETELIVELGLEELRSLLRSNLRRYIRTSVVDLGTGSGNIIISLAHNIEHKAYNNLNFIGIDIYKKALTIARQNAKRHKLDKTIKFLQGSILEPIAKKSSMFHDPCYMIILANLPYLSSEIYSATPSSVKDYEPPSALWSPQKGLRHYRELLKQLAQISKKYPLLAVSCLLEISPEQKLPLRAIIQSLFPAAQIIFHRDLARKWRVCQIKF